MSLLEKISAAVQRPAKKNVAEIAFSEKNIAQNFFENASLCKKCNEDLFWCSKYSATEFFCSTCNPPPKIFLVGGTVAVHGNRWHLVDARTPEIASQLAHLPRIEEAYPPQEPRRDTNRRETDFLDDLPPAGQLQAFGAIVEAFEREPRQAELRLLSQPCRRCRSGNGRVIAIHGGNSERVDCANCRAFAEFGKWAGSE